MRSGYCSVAETSSGRVMSLLVTVYMQHVVIDLEYKENGCPL